MAISKRFYFGTPKKESKVLGFTSSEKEKGVF